MELKNKTDELVAKVCDLRRRSCENIDAIPQHFSARRRIKGSQDMKKRALAHARRSCQRNHSAWGNIQIDPRKHADFVIALKIALFEVDRFKTHNYCLPY